jgi:hypothetical protein
MSVSPVGESERKLAIAAVVAAAEAAAEPEKEAKLATAAREGEQASERAHGGFTVYHLRYLYYFVDHAWLILLVAVRVAARAKATKAVLKRLAAAEAAERREAEEAAAVVQLEQQNSSLAAQLMALKQQTRTQQRRRKLDSKSDAGWKRGGGGVGRGKQQGAKGSPRTPLAEANYNALDLAGKAMTVSPQPPLRTGPGARAASVRSAGAERPKTAAAARSDRSGQAGHPKHGDADASGVAPAQQQQPPQQQRQQQQQPGDTLDEFARASLGFDSQGNRLIHAPHGQTMTPRAAGPTYNPESDVRRELPSWANEQAGMQHMDAIMQQSGPGQQQQQQQAAADAAMDKIMDNSCETLMTLEHLDLPPLLTAQNQSLSLLPDPFPCRMSKQS